MMRARSPLLSRSANGAVWGMLLAGILTGCAHTAGINPFEADKPTYTSFNGTFIASPVATAAEKAPLPPNDRKTVPVAANSPVLKAFSGLPDVAAQAAYLETSGVVEDPALDAYLQGVAGQLLRGWPGEKPQIHVYVRTTDTFQPHSTLGNDVFLSVGVLRNLENEHQLASVLAHEIGHILLRHFQRDEIIRKQKEMISAGASMAILGAFAADTKMTRSSSGQLNFVQRNDVENREAMATAVVAGLAMNEVTDTLIDKGWARQQEDEADLIGIDLMIAANYDPAAYQVVLQKMDQMKAEQQSRLETTRAAYAKSMEDMAKSGNLSGIVSGAPSMALGVGVSWFQDWRDHKRMEHLAAPERMANVAAYVDREYSSRDRRAIAKRNDNYATTLGSGTSKTILENHYSAIMASRKLEEGKLAEAERYAAIGISGPTEASPHPRYIMALVKRRFGRDDEALKHIEVAYKSPMAPAVVYSDLAFQYAYRKRFDDALAVLGTGQERLGAEDRLLPAYITVYKMSGRMDAAQKSYERCKAQQSDPLRQQCAQLMDDQAEAKKGPSPFTHLFGT